MEGSLARSAETPYKGVTWVKRATDGEVCERGSVSMDL